MWQTVSLFLLGSYYTYLGDVPPLAVVALLVYVGCYQVILKSLVASKLFSMVSYVLLIIIKQLLPVGHYFGW